MSSQVKVTVIGEIQWRFFAAHRLDLHHEAIVLRQLTLALTHHIARITLEHVRIDVGQRDRRALHISLPVELVEAHQSTVEMVLSIDILRQVVSPTIQLEVRISDPIRHTTHESSEVRVLWVEVFLECVEAHHNICYVAIPIRNLDCPDDGAVAEQLRG